MRRTILAAAAAAVAALVLASPAGAVTTAHFSVAAINHTSHRTHNGFAFTERLRRHHRSVGHDRVQCRVNRRTHKANCEAVFFFAAGKIKAKGNFGRGDNRVQVTGGTSAFDGVAGKILIHNVNASRTRLEFFLVR
jgi:hypothetical protein